MDVQDAPLAGASDLLRTDSRCRAAYEELIGVLDRAAVPRQEKAKAKAIYIYDQTALQQRLRSSLIALGWKGEKTLAPQLRVGRVLIPEVKSDMLKDGVHTIFEFGNRASYSTNLLTRGVFGVVTRAARLTAMVTPTDAFARQIDTNLTTYERVTGELGRLSAALPQNIFGPLVIIGVAP